MWTRKLLKTNAKQALQGRYWRSFWICLVLSFVGLGGAGANSGNAARQAVSTVTDDTTAYDIINSIPDSMLGAIFVGMLIGIPAFHVSDPVALAAAAGVVAVLALALRPSSKRAHA